MRIVSIHRVHLFKIGVFQFSNRRSNHNEDDDSCSVRYYPNIETLKVNIPLDVEYDETEETLIIHEDPEFEYIQEDELIKFKITDNN